ncbi:MAG: VOC family protein [Gemmatimonadota bacterium]
MHALVPYLVFPGSCREALGAYRAALGGEIVTLQTFAESPLDVPPELSERVFNAELRAGQLVLKASDDLPSHPVQVGGNVSLFLTFAERSQRDRVFGQLVEGGATLFAPDGEFSMLRDRFGIQWMLVG